MAKLQANITYQPIVESISRKFVPRKETCSAGKTAGPVVVMSYGWMGGGVRKSNRAGLGTCTRNYLVIRANARTTQPSADELTQRGNFAAVVEGRNYINKDLSQLTNVQLKYVEGKDDPTKTLNGVSCYGYTFLGWIFAVQMAGLMSNPSYNVKQFPTTWDV